jgi:phosphoglycerate kinase
VNLPRLSGLSDVEGARVLARLDLNVPVKNGEVQDDTRIQAALDTVRWLDERASVIACCSHLGKAKGAPDPAYSLRPVAEALGAALGREVEFVDDCLSPTISQAGPGSILVLENLRFHPGEKANDADFAAALCAPFSHYVNDAFGTAHRAHASVEAAPRRFSHGRRAAGFLMEREVSSLGRLVDDPEPPFVAIIGGAKVSTKTAPLEALVERVQRLLIGGGMANTFLKARGLEIGRSLVEDEMLDVAREVIERADARGLEILLPEDLVVADDLDEPTRVEVVAADAVPADMMIVDLGPGSRRAFENALADARTVFWNGPMGVFEVERFAEGTSTVARAMAACDGFTVIGGGESVMAIKRAGLEDAIDHVSTGGGASLQFLTGEPLPALVALEAE